MVISDTGFLTWTPLEGVLSSGLVTIIVADEEYDVAQAFAVTVTQVNDAPVISNISDLTIDEDSQFGYDVIAIDVDNDPLEYSVSTISNNITTCSFQ